MRRSGSADRVPGPVVGSFTLRDPYTPYLWTVVTFVAEALEFHGQWVVLSDARITECLRGGSVDNARTDRVPGARRYAARRVDNLTYDTCAECAA